jgi:DNA repair exonuclease SbcCD ATPase subunit
MTLYYIRSWIASKGTLEMTEEEIKALQEQLKQLQEREAHFKAEAERWQGEAKNAFKARDELKQKVREPAPAPDTAAQMEQLYKTLQEKEAQLEAIAKEQAVKERTRVLRKVAKAQGIKENYLDKLDKFVDLNVIDPEKDITASIAVEGIRSSYPDFFLDKGTQMQSQTNPRLPSTSVGDLQAQYDKALRNKAPIAELMALRQKIEENK